MDDPQFAMLQLEYESQAIEIDKGLGEILKNKSDHIIYDIASTLLTGGKETHYIERNYITYKESKFDDKFYNAVGALYGVANTVTVGKHDYRNVHIYNNWNDYSQSTKGQGGLLKYKK